MSKYKMHIFVVDGVTYKMHKFEFDGKLYYQYRSLFRLQEPDKKHGDAYIVYIRKGNKMNGNVLLRMAESIAKDLGAKRIFLQDAAYIYCKSKTSSNASKSEFELGFRSMLSHGQTWYELHGYYPIMTSSSSQIAKVKKAVELYAHLHVQPIIVAIELQIAALRDGFAWKPASQLMFTSSKFSDDGLEPHNIEPQTLSSMLRSRRKLLKLLRTANSKDSRDSRDSRDSNAMLGEWLIKLDCNDYSHFMRSMYGAREGPCTSIEEVGGVRTPTLSEFQRANWLRRYSHKISWYKNLIST